MVQTVVAHGRPSSLVKSGICLSLSSRGNKPGHAMFRHRQVRARHLGLCRNLFNSQGFSCLEP